MTGGAGIKAIVRIVADGLLAGEAQEQTIRKLVAAGLPEPQAADVFLAVKTACRLGVQSVVTDGISGGPPPDPLLAEAFKVGQQSMRRVTTRTGLDLSIRIATAAAICGGVIVWLMRR